MNLSEFNIVTKEIENGIKSHRRTIEEALNEEHSKGNSVDLNKVINIVKKYEKIDEIPYSENKRIAVCYTGNPEITITYILDSILYNNNIMLCISDNQAFNAILIKTIIDSIKNAVHSNDWINYNENYNELYIRDNKKYIDKVIYVGDFFEYDRLKRFLKRDVEYNNFGYIKLFINRAEKEDEYNDIMQFARKNNITIESYEDIDEFISESKETDYSVVFGDRKILSRVKKELRSNEILVNSFPYNAYELKINR